MDTGQTSKRCSTCTFFNRDKKKKVSQRRKAWSNIDRSNLFCLHFMQAQLYFPSLALFDRFKIAYQVIWVPRSHKLRILATQNGRLENLKTNVFKNPTLRTKQTLLKRKNHVCLHCDIMFSLLKISKAHKDQAPT